MSAPRRPRRRRSKRSPSRRSKPFIRSEAPRIDPPDVVLVGGKNRPVGKEGARRQFWRIMHKGVQAGRVFIVAQRPTEISDPDASITVELNQASRGQGIGTIAFRKASELSGYPKVYAAMRKSNLASQIAATRAGFVSVEGEPTNELVLVWQRSH